MKKAMNLFVMCIAMSIIWLCNIHAKTFESEIPDDECFSEEKTSEKHAQTFNETLNSSFNDGFKELINNGYAHFEGFVAENEPNEETANFALVECNNGALGWEDIQPIFLETGCLDCHGQTSNLDLSSYATFSLGGTLCGEDISTGSTLVDIITMGANCGGTSVSAMNTMVTEAMTPSEIQKIQSWIDGGAPELCEDFCFIGVNECGDCGFAVPTWYIDQDGDGLGDQYNTTQACEQPEGYVSSPGDWNDACDDYAYEWYDIKILFQENGCLQCHFSYSEGLPPEASGLDLNFYNTFMNGGDLCGSDITTGTTLVDIIVDGSMCNGTLVNSMNDYVNGAFDEQELEILQAWIDGGAPEQCEDFCANGVIDECGKCNGNGFASGTCDCEGTPETIWYLDSDNDGLGDINSTVGSCTQPDGYVSNSLDDCDGVVDECGDCNGPGPGIWYVDADGDGFGSSTEPPILECSKPDGYVDNNTDDCDGEYDACGICNGFGIIDGTCDCEGTLPIVWYQDLDGDGLGNPVEAQLSCNQPDGYVENNSDTNDTCNGVIDACGVCNGPGVMTWYADVDGDGLGDPEFVVEACTQPEGFVSNSSDTCDGVVDECGVCNGDGIEQGKCDCEGTDPLIWFADLDGDGLGNPNETIESCSEPEGFVSNSFDTDDTCDGVIDACGVCNGSGIQAGTCDCEGNVPTIWYLDADADGMGDLQVNVVSCTQPEGYVSNSIDGDDSCNGVVDECGVCNGLGVPIGTCDCEGNLPNVWYADSDGDGMGDISVTLDSCDQPQGFVANSDDADDTCNGVYDECGVCNGAGIPIGTCDCSGTLPGLWFVDNDGDGMGDVAFSVESCDQPEGYVANSNDTDDTCNGVYDECGVCNGAGIPIGTCDCAGGLPTMWYVDNDGDGMGDASTFVESCDQPEGYVANSNDSDDTCNGVYDECGVCNGAGIPIGTCDCAGGLPTMWYVDNDGDGMGDVAFSVESCDQPEGYVANSNDTDDACNGVYDECGVCNGNGIPVGTCDCAGGLPTMWYVDNDGDGMGDALTFVESCDQPEGYVANSNDSDDTCNGVYDECGVCNGAGIPIGTCDCAGGLPTMWYVDNDGDGMGDVAFSVESCDQPEGYVANSNDTDDACNGVYDECGVCNGNGIPVGTCDCAGGLPTMWYVDNDGDGMGDASTFVESCDQPEGYVANSNDSDDTCNGVYDECGVCNGNGIPVGTCDCAGGLPTMWYVDNDGDGMGDAATFVESCDQPEGYVANDTDTDDTCDGTYDECGVCNGAGIPIGTCDCAGTQPTMWFVDNDGDGLGYFDTSIESCDQPLGYVSNMEDDDDGCNGVYDECGICNGSGVPIGACDCEGNLPSTWYADLDGDGLGDAGSTIQDCTQPLNYVNNNLDECDGQLDECGVCNGNGIPQGVCDCDGTLAQPWYPDADGDGLGDPMISYMACDPPLGFVDNNLDTCDGVEDVCGICNGDGPTIWYEDADGDGLGNAVSFVESCTQPSGFVPNNNDQDDTGGFACAPFGAEVTIQCVDDNQNYYISVFVEGQYTDYMVSSTIDGAYNGVIEGSAFIDGPFPAGQGFDYTISLIDNPSCFTTVFGSESSCVPTALDLIDFYGENTRYGNELYWVTAAEEDMSHFELQKSINGTDFYLIADIPARNKHTLESYNFVDVEVEAKSFYRLKMLEVDGSFEYSNIIEISLRDQVNVDIYPNPVNDELNLSFGSLTDQVEMEILDLSGKVIASERFDGLNILTINTTGFIPGVYLMKLNINGNVQTHKVIKL